MNLDLKSEKLILLIFNIILIIGGLILRPNIIVVQAFYLIYSLIIFYKFSNEIGRYLYFCALLYIITTSGNSKYVFIFLILYMFQLLKKYFKNKELFLKNNNVKKYYTFFFIFLIYMIFSIVFAADKTLAIKYCCRYLLMCSIFLLMFIENKNIKQLKETLKFFLYIYVGFLFLGMLEVCGIRYGLPNIYIDSNINYDYIKRIPEVFFYNPNNYSVVLSIGIAALFTKLLYSENKKKRIMYLILILISEIEIIFARSRIAWIVLFLIFGFTIILKIFNKRENKKLRRIHIKKSFQVMGISFLLFFSIALIPGMEPYYGKFADSIMVKQVKKIILKESSYKYKKEIAPSIEIGGKGSENERFTLMYNVMDGVIGKKNLLGFGVGNIGVYMKQKGNTYGIVNVHSFWFEFLGDFGLPMFIYLIIIYCNMLWDTLKIYRNLPFEKGQYFLMTLIIEFIMIFLAFAPSTVIRFTPFWIVLGICFSLVSNRLNYEN